MFNKQQKVIRQVIFIPLKCHLLISEKSSCYKTPKSSLCQDFLWELQQNAQEKLLTLSGSGHCFWSLRGEFGHSSNVSHIYSKNEYIYVDVVVINKIQIHFKALLNSQQLFSICIFSTNTKSTGTVKWGSTKSFDVKKGLVDTIPNLEQNFTSAGVNNFKCKYPALTRFSSCWIVSQEHVYSLLPTCAVVLLCIRLQFLGFAPFSSPSS